MNMARRYTKRVQAKEVVSEPLKTCRDCLHSYDWHETGADGEPFLCRCPYYTEGRYCRFLDDKQCRQFKDRKA